MTDGGAAREMNDTWGGATHPDVAQRAPDALAAPVLFVLVVVALLVRLALPAPLINLYIPYTLETGAFYEKLHIGTYLLLSLAPLGLAIKPLRLRADELPIVRALLRFSLAIIGIAALLLAIGRGGPAVIFVDTYLSAALAGLLLFMLPPPARRLVGYVVLALFVASALVGILETATRQRFMPYDMAELGFRPTGFAGHPLMLGLLSCAAIGFAFTLPMPWQVRFAAVAVLLIGTLAAEARIATLMSAASLILLALTAKWHGLTRRQSRRAKVILVVVLVLLAVPLVFVLQAAGLMSRLAEGLYDESSQARIIIYQIFDFVSLRDVLLGADIAWIERLAFDELKLEIIESSPVVFIFMLGLPGAVVFTVLLARFFIKLCQAAPPGAVVGTIVFIITALSNNTLSTKTASVTAIVVLLVAAQAMIDRRAAPLR